MTGTPRFPSGSRERGFTLVELLVAITLLGIIMGAIGAMITTAFRTTTIVSNRLEGSRAPKLVSNYWGPDVESAESVSFGGSSACGPPSGAGAAAIVSFTSKKLVSETGVDAPALNPGADQTATWWTRTLGARVQVVRMLCDGGGAVRSIAVVVPDVGSDGVSVKPTDPASDQYTIDVNVPDRNEPSKQFHFTVDGARVVSSVPVPPT